MKLIKGLNVKYLRLTVLSMITKHVALNVGRIVGMTIRLIEISLVRVLRITILYYFCGLIVNRIRIFQ